MLLRSPSVLYLVDQSDSGIESEDDEDVYLETVITPEKSYPCIIGGAKIFDGMCLIQQLPCGLETFGDVSDFLLRRITNNEQDTVFFITDQYLENSVKSCERGKRAKVGAIRVTPERRGQRCPKQWKHFLSLGANKK